MAPHSAKEVLQEEVQAGVICERERPQIPDGSLSQWLAVLSSLAESEAPREQAQAHGLLVRCISLYWHGMYINSILLHLYLPDTCEVLWAPPKKHSKELSSEQSPRNPRSWPQSRAILYSDSRMHHNPGSRGLKPQQLLWASASDH